MDKNFGKKFSVGLANFPNSSKEYAEIKNRIKEILKIKSDAQFNYYKWGTFKMDVDEACRIEELFKEYGIEHPWNEV